ncbi:MAG: response regulator [Candidatus Hydrogenedens sp.]|nr:response regulator [Candidatus Hydrogenedens sp.]
MNTASNVLIVDDEDLLRDHLAQAITMLGHKATTAPNGEAALQQAVASPPDVIFLDCAMPDMDGFEVLRALQSRPETGHIPVVMISGHDSSDAVRHCIESGADDYLLKPLDIDMVKARLYGCLKRKRRHDQESHVYSRVQAQYSQLEYCLREQLEETSRAQLATIFALSKLAESRDPETGQHLERMREYCRALLVYLSKDPRFANVVTESFINVVYQASPLHDIGKVGIPDHVLLKPGRLTPEEHDIIKTHTTIGAETLRHVDRQFPGSGFLKVGIQIAQSHHERWDGAGYPEGLSGTTIPLSARVLAVGDVYDALTSKRCYKEAFTHERSREIIVEGSGTAFDPDIVEAFLAIEDEFRGIRRDLAAD